ncbi:hypothetical protein HYX02_03270 [Candidatus Woesearchaeota archaeon]|nr:hypothetical protein [Candidatus Woesearchaeota archaeon]
MLKEKIWISLLIILITILGCSSADKTTGKTIAAESDIYTENLTEEQVVQQEIQINNTQEITEQEIQINNTEEIAEQEITLQNETSVAEQEIKVEEFKFSPTSIVNTQHNISLSLDDFKHEIKSVYWGKITEITMTVLNKGDKPFKPKVLVLLYDEKDFKEEWLKPKAEIQFEKQLNAGEHTTRQAIVNMAFDDINLTKNFKLILVNADDPGNKPIVVVENEFKPT